MLQLLGRAAQSGGNHFESINELTEVSPPDSHTVKSKFLCFCSKPWLNTLPKPWAGPGCEIPENQSPALSLAPFPWEGALFRRCRNFIRLTHPARILAKALLNRGSREAPAVFYRISAPGRAFPNRFIFLSVWEEAPPSAAARWDTGSLSGAGGMQTGYTEMLHGKTAFW